jgi:hypothetical protein
VGWMAEFVMTIANLATNPFADSPIGDSAQHPFSLVLNFALLPFPRGTTLLITLFLLRGREFVVVAHCPEVPVHRTDPASSVRVVAVPKDSLFAVARQTAVLSLRLPLEDS